MIYDGRCACGAVRVAYATDVAPSVWRLRACQCGFCRSHDAKTVADPAARLTITAESSDDLVRHRFALRTADFLLCRRCHAYVCAVIEDAEGHAFATLNTNVLDIRPALTQPASPVDYSGETAEARIARRLEAWTPVACTIGQSR
jgi:hypothetical protein